MMYERALGAYEAAKVQMIRGFLAPGMTFLDIGANKGYFSLLAASILKDSGRIVAAEPEPTNCGWLRRTMRRDLYPNVDVMQVAVGSDAKRGRLYLGERSGWHSLVESGDRPSVEIEVTTLDALVEHFALERVDVVKIDVEGSEVEVLRGARRTLTHESDPVILMDVHPQLGVDPKEISQAAATYGLRIFNIEDPTTEIQAPPETPSEIVLRK